MKHWTGTSKDLIQFLIQMLTFLLYQKWTKDPKQSSPLAGTKAVNVAHDVTAKAVQF